MKNLLDNLEELGFETQIQVEKFLTYFKRNYLHVYNISLSDPEVISFLKQSYVRKVSVERKADLFYDYVLSQGYCDVVE